MSDHQDAPDPIDQAYVQAEAMLDDDKARAARRARVLAAVAQEASAPPTPTLPAPSNRWRPGRWLAAASVAGLGVLIATKIYQPPRPTRTPPGSVSSLRPSAPAAADAASSPPVVAVTPQAPAPPSVAKTTPPPAAQLPVQASPAPAPAPPEPAPPPPPPPPPPAPEAAPPPPAEATVVAERRASDQAVAQGVTARSKVPVAVSVFTGPSRDVRQMRPEALAGAPSDLAANLRAAAAAGRTAEVQSLLGQGVAVDAADAYGDTALMDSVRANQPATAAVLRQRGASLDRKNDAGQSARDLATEKGDAAIDRALGLQP